MKTRLICASAVNLLSILTLFLTVVAGQEDEETAGTHSTSFDHKYYLPEDLIISPRTHPGLFSFTGRWLLSPARPTRPEAQTYHSTLWPGNSVAALVHGSDVSVQIIPKPQGWTKDYHFYVSVDGGDDVRYEIPAFNSSELTKSGESIRFEVKIEGLGRDSDSEEYGKKGVALEPHTIRLTSVPETPLSFEGIAVQTALISQGKDWIEEQDDRVIMEFIGEGSDAERKGGFFDGSSRDDKHKTQDSWRTSIQYRVGEALGVRHSHMSAGICLLSSCNKDISGLSTQYFQISPFLHPPAPDAQPDSSLDPHHSDHLKAPYRFPSFSTNPPVPIPDANFVIVDLGVLDLLVYRQPPDEYHHELIVFLARVRQQAHPSAKILVVARSPEYVAMSSIPDALPATLEMDAQRKKLYAVTKSAVSILKAGVGDENIHLLQLPVGAGSEEKAYLSAICPYLIPPPSVLNKLSINKFGRSNIAWSKPQRVCLALGSEGYVERLHNASWKVLLLFVGFFGLWISRGTLVGACAAVCGRRRLRMEVVEIENGRGRGLLGGERTRKEEDYDKQG